MSCFTTIKTIDDEFQIKTGHDNCDEYQIGDLVKWHPSPYTPGDGTLMDGAYWGTSVNDKPDHWVIIKDHRVVGLASVEESELDLVKRFGIKPPPKSLWTARQWAEKRKRDQARKREHIRWRRRTNGMTAVERWMSCSGQFVRAKLKEKSFARQIFRIPE